MQYFIKRGEKVQGPFSREQLLGFAKAKKITAADLVSNSAQGPFQELKSAWASIQNPTAASTSSEPIGQTTEPVPASPQISTPVVQERFKTPGSDADEATPITPPQSGHPSHLTSVRPKGKNKFLLIGGVSGGAVLLLTIIAVAVLNSGLFAPGSKITETGDRLPQTAKPELVSPEESKEADFPYLEAESTYLLRLRELSDLKKRCLQELDMNRIRAEALYTKAAQDLKEFYAETKWNFRALGQAPIPFTLVSLSYQQFGSNRLPVLMAHCRRGKIKYRIFTEVEYTSLPLTDQADAVKEIGLHRPDQKWLQIAKEFKSDLASLDEGDELKAQFWFADCHFPSFLLAGDSIEGVNRNPDSVNELPIIDLQWKSRTQPLPTEAWYLPGGMQTRKDCSPCEALGKRVLDALKQQDESALVKCFPDSDDYQRWEKWEFKDISQKVPSLCHKMINELKHDLPFWRDAEYLTALAGHSGMHFEYPYRFSGDLRIYFRLYGDTYCLDYRGGPMKDGDKWYLMVPQSDVGDDEFSLWRIEGLQ